MLFQPAQYLEIDLVGVLAQLLHIPETGDLRSLLDRVEAGRHLVDVLLADGLVEDSRPAHVEGAGHHLVVGADGRRGEEEGVFAGFAAESDGETGSLPLGFNGFALGRVQQFAYADRPVVVDAGLFSALEVGVGAAVQPLSDILRVVEPDRADGACGISFPASLCAGRVLT